MNSRNRPSASIERDVTWMDDTYPLHQERIAQALDDFAAQSQRADSKLAQYAADHAVCHRVTGPFEGFYIASYACPMGNLGAEFTGHYKVCAFEPESYWDATSSMVAACDETAPTALAAMHLAEALALQRIAAVRSL